MKISEMLNRFFALEKELEIVTKSEAKESVPNFECLRDFGQINSIFDYVLNPDITIARKAAETVHRLFKTVTVYKNKAFYESFRYLRIKKADIKKFDRFAPDIRISLLCIASLNGNGYSREEALAKLGATNNLAVIPFTFFRLADWVDSIHVKAKASVAALLLERNTIFFIQNHKLITWVLSIERHDLSGLYKQIVSSILKEKVEYEDLNCLGEGERLFYYKLLAEYGLFDSVSIDQMLSDKYYLIRMLLIQHFDKIEEPKQILAKLLIDKSQKVRQGAIKLVSIEKISDYQSVFERLIFDKTSSVRTAARRLLNEIGTYDFKTIYLKCIDKGENLVGSILGFSELAGKNETVRLVQFLDDEKANVKTASLIGIYNLDPDSVCEKAYEILESVNPISTKRAAEMILSELGSDLQRLRKLFDQTDFTGKKIILRLINKSSGWSAAGDFLKAMTDENDELKHIGHTFLESWHRYTTRLGIRQSQEDKEYVLYWYNKAKMLGLKVPEDIPFIFGEK